MPKIKLRYYIIISIVIITVCIAVIIIGLKTTAPLKIFNDLSSKADVLQDINGVTPNTKYKFEFDIDAKTGITSKEIYQIQICERNKYDDIIKTHEINFGTYQGTKNIEFTTTEYTYKFQIKFKSSSRAGQRGLTINSMKINDENRAVNYKYLPIRLVDKIKDIKIKTISVQGRAVYIKDSLKIIAEHGILGVGADGWKDVRAEVQEYLDYANESHSYVLEIFCEFGIVGFIALVLIFVELIKIFIDLIKNKKADIMQFSIFLALMVILAHSLLDFDLSFMYMLVIVFTFIAMLDKKEKNYKKLEYFIKIVVSIFLIVAIYFDTKICVYKFIKEQENPYSVDIILNNLDTENNFLNDIRKIVDRRKYTSHAYLFTTIVDRNKLEEEEYLELYNIIKSEENLTRNNIELKMNELDFYEKILKNISNSSKIYEDCKNAMILEIEQIKELLEDPEKARLSFEEIEEYKEDVTEIEEIIEKF